MITATSIAPPVDVLKLGTFIHYHHRAGVARIAPLSGPWYETDRYGIKTSTPRKGTMGWKLFDGYYKNETVSVDNCPKIEDESGFTWSLNHAREMFFDFPRKRGINKSVFTWPEEGNGYIIGLIRRGIGQAYQATHSTMFEDFEPGGFILDTWVWLYVVKEHLRGTEYILCPLNAVTPVPDVPR